MTTKAKAEKSRPFSSSLSRASAVSLGLAWGLVGLLQPIGLLCALVLLLLRCRLLWALFGILAGVGLTFGLDISPIGHGLLTSEGLATFWTRLFNTPWIAISGFNETRVIGGLVIGAIVFPLLFLVLFVLGRKKSAAVDSGAKV